MITRRLAYGAGALAVLSPLNGCSHSPDFNILGSYFPAWLLCITVGIVLTTLIYWLLQRMHLETEVRPSIVVYPCMAAFLAFTLWLALFSR
jgi:succinate dehydrogenase hydrophobic anchor subunit